MTGLRRLTDLLQAFGYKQLNTTHAEPLQGNEFVVDYFPEEKVNVVWLTPYSHCCNINLRFVFDENGKFIEARI